MIIITCWIIVIIGLSPSTGHPLFPATSSHRHPSDFVGLSTKDLRLRPWQMFYAQKETACTRNPGTILKFELLVKQEQVNDVGKAKSKSPIFWSTIPAHICGKSGLLLYWCCLLGLQKTNHRWHPVARDQDARRFQEIHQPESASLHRIERKKINCYMDNLSTKNGYYTLICSINMDIDSILIINL